MVLGLPFDLPAGLNFPAIGILIATLAFLYWRWRHKKNEGPAEKQHREIKIEDKIQKTARKIVPLLQDIGEHIAEAHAEIENAEALAKGKADLIATNRELYSRLKFFNDLMQANPEKVNTKESIALIIWAIRNPHLIGNIIEREGRENNELHRKIDPVLRRARELLLKEKEKAQLVDAVRKIQKDKEKKEQEIKMSGKGSVRKIVAKATHKADQKDKTIDKLEGKDIRLEHKVIRDERALFNIESEIVHSVRKLRLRLFAQAHAVRRQIVIPEETLHFLQHYNENTRKIPALRYDRYKKHAEKLNNHYQSQLAIIDDIDEGISRIRDIAIRVGVEEHILRKVEAKEKAMIKGEQLVYN